MVIVVSHVKLALLKSQAILSMDIDRYHLHICKVSGLTV